MMLREALQALAAPRIAKKILREALRAAGLNRVPVEGPLLRAFINSELLPAAEQTLGSDARDHLARVLSQVLPRSRPAPKLRRRPSHVGPDRPTAPAPPDHAAGERRRRKQQETLEIIGGVQSLGSPKVPVDGSVLGRMELARMELARQELAPQEFSGHSPVAEAAPTTEKRWLLTSASEEHIEAFRSLAPDCTVVQDAVALLQSLDHIEESPVLIVDCHFPAVHAATLATLAAEFPTGSEIVLWGARPEQTEEVRTLSQSDHRWRTFPGTMTTEDVVRSLRFGERNST